MRGEVIGIVSSQMKSGQNLNFAIPANLIPIMEQPSVEQVKELLEPYYPDAESSNPGSSEEVIREVAINSIEEGISDDYLVQSAKCNIFDNKSMFIKIYIEESVEARKLRYDNLEMLISAIRGYFIMVTYFPSVGDLTVQICNSTAIQCTMHSYRSQVCMSINDLNISGKAGLFVNKMLSTMTPVIGSHLVHGKLVPVKKYV